MFNIVYMNTIIKNTYLVYKSMLVPARSVCPALLVTTIQCMLYIKFMFNEGRKKCYFGRPLLLLLKAFAPPFPLLILNFYTQKLHKKPHPKNSPKKSKICSCLGSIWKILHLTEFFTRTSLWRL